MARMCSPRLLSALCGVALLAPSAALGMSCDEIMNMVRINIPEDVIADQVHASGHSFSADDVSCLIQRNAPKKVVEAARANASEPIAAEPTPAAASEQPQAPSAFDTTELLGGALEDFEPEEEAGEGGPADLEAAIESYRNNKALTASEQLWSMYSERKYPSEESRVLYYLSKSLLDLEMYHSAQHHLMQIIRKGVEDPYFKYALPRLVAISELTGNDHELRRVVDKIRPDLFPRQAANHLNYLAGRKLYEQGNLAGALEAFGRVNPSTHHYLRAQFYLGVIHQERNKLQSSVRAFREVIVATPPVVANDQAIRHIEDIKDLATINTARVYFGLRRYETADATYGSVDRRSSYWPLSLYERAWSQFWTGDVNRTFGLLLTTHSPYFAESTFLPELGILRALTYFNLCEYDDVEATLSRFEQRYTPMQEELQAFVDRFKGEKQNWDQAYATYFQDAHADSTLSASFFSRALQNQDLAAYISHLDVMAAERKKIDGQKAIWRSTIGDALRQQLERDTIRYQQFAGGTLLKEANAWAAKLSSLLTQAKIIRFEVVDAQRADYEFRASEDIQVDAGTARRIDFATSRDVIYWPFNGEFWRDELGYYRYTEHGSCE